MQLISALVQQIAIMFALIGLGYLLRRTGVLSDGASRDFGKILLNCVLPAVIVRSFWGAAGDGRGQEVAWAFLISMLLLVVAMIAGRLLQGRNPEGDFSVAFSNAGFIGVPLTQAILGDDAVLYIAPFIALLNVLQWTYGQNLLSGGKGYTSMRSVVTSPMLIALMLGAGVYFASIPFPSVIGELMGSVCGLNTPLAMLVLGCYLAESDLPSLIARKDLYPVTLERLAVVPLLSAGVLLFLPGGYELKMALLLAAAAPTGTNVAIFARQNDGDYAFASGCVCLTTLASLVSIPCIVGLSSCLF